MTLKLTSLSDVFITGISYFIESPRDTCISSNDFIGFGFTDKVYFLLYNYFI